MGKTCLQCVPAVNAHRTDMRKPCTDPVLPNRRTVYLQNSTQLRCADPLVQHHQLLRDSVAADWLSGHDPHAGPEEGLRQVHQGRRSR